VTTLVIYREQHSMVQKLFLNLNSSLVVLLMIAVFLVIIRRRFLGGMAKPTISKDHLLGVIQEARLGKEWYHHNAFECD